jgi:RES domain-containing protein
MHATPAADAFSGAGAERFGGRWNRIGTRAAYASSSRSLAALEYLAHVDPNELPADLVFANAAFDEADVEERMPPAGWDAVDPAVAQDFGERWLRGGSSLVLAVPSAIVRSERNYILNPAHPKMTALSIAAELEDFVFDERLLKR